MIDATEIWNRYSEYLGSSEDSERTAFIAVVGQAVRQSVALARDELIDCGMPSESPCKRGVHAACKKHMYYRALQAEAALSKVETETIERCAQAVRKVSGMPSAYEDAIRKLITPEER